MSMLSSGSEAAKTAGAAVKKKASNGRVIRMSRAMPEQAGGEAAILQALHLQTPLGRAGLQGFGPPQKRKARVAGQANELHGNGCDILAKSVHGPQGIVQRGNAMQRNLHRAGGQREHQNCVKEASS